ncbi:hypothetical protein EDD29_0018 [Actinocorallia herbida]|uniref:Uncharacterized protein n=1 Tax=Actinocorallia herbida TaxID=58109 RepID=A0A3N1CP91_9ACTN|nr:hypothetical protein [Actinocorallia herbida]ROO82538.1 hypothetical protein EDD29_0018 [Actinocorallia herbida]
MPNVLPVLLSHVLGITPNACQSVTRRGITTTTAAGHLDAIAEFAEQLLTPSIGVVIAIARDCTCITRAWLTDDPTKAGRIITEVDPPHTCPAEPPS